MEYRNTTAFDEKDIENVRALSGVGSVNREEAATMANMARRHLLAARVSASIDLRKRIAKNPASTQATTIARSMRDWSAGVAPKPESQIIVVGMPNKTIASVIDLLCLQRDVAESDMRSSPNNTAAVYNYLSAVAALAALRQVSKDIGGDYLIDAAM